MAHLHVVRESDPRETRCPVTPESAAKLVKLGLEVSVEEGAGSGCGFSRSDYEAAGARFTPAGEIPTADIVAHILPPSPEQAAKLPSGCLSLGLLDPFRNRSLIQTLAEGGVSAVSLEMIPRSTLAQKMDVLSSQANLAGYAAVLAAAGSLPGILPMMMTPAGTLQPARVFVIGVGVAGLQAIATAKRLGARVEAFDTRPVVEEQVRYLGARFVKIDLGETGQTDQGYAKELTPEQIARQQEAMAKVCGLSDIVITTAKLFGRPAPKLVTAEMISRMKPGSIIVDLAAETGGNVEGTIPDETVTTSNGVRILGTARFECSLPVSASAMLASNYANFIEHFWNREEMRFEKRLNDPILSGCLLTNSGAVIHEKFRGEAA